MIEQFRITPMPLFLMALFFFSPVSASPHADKINALLAMQQAPVGVVFEIASGDANALQWVIPKIQEYTRLLRKKFPGLEVAVVTHGQEQFALQQEKQAEYQKVHDSVKELSEQENVPVHICQTFAGWKGVEPEEFPKYVSVSATGPQQVNDYVDLGYTLIKIRRP